MKETKILKLTICAYNNVEEYIEIEKDRFYEAQGIIQECADEWDDDLMEQYEDICSYYESKLDEAGIEYTYINYDEKMEIL